MPPDDHPHQVRARVGSDAGANAPRFAALLAGARDIAGYAWDAWWNDRDRSELIVGFETEVVAERFRAWLEERDWL